MTSDSDEQDAVGQSRRRLHGIFRRRIGELESAALKTALEDAGVPGAPLYTAKDIYNDPHFRERGAITPVTDPRLGEVWMQGVVPPSPVRPAGSRRPAPSWAPTTRRCT